MRLYPPNEIKFVAILAIVIVRVKYPISVRLRIFAKYIKTIVRNTNWNTEVVVKPMTLCNIYLPNTLLNNLKIRLADLFNLIILSKYFKLFVIINSLNNRAHSSA